MRTTVPALLPLLRSELQVDLLALLILNPDREWTLSELAQSTGGPKASVHRELMRAVDAGIVARDVGQRPHRFVGAKESPLFEPLSLLLERTVGVEQRLRVVLEAAQVSAALIHGSWARGVIDPTSDVDLLAIGDLDRKHLRPQLREIADRIGRPIDLTQMTSSELRARREQGDRLLEAILAGPAIWLVGSAQALSP